MQDSQVRFATLAAKTVVSHTITYFICGLLAYKLLNYEAIINNPCSGMRPTTSLWVIMGAPLQIFRGILFASILYLLQDKFFSRKNGWLVLSWMMVGIGILGTYGAPGGRWKGSSTRQRLCSCRCEVIWRSSPKRFCSPPCFATGSATRGSG